MQTAAIDAPGAPEPEGWSASADVDDLFPDVVIINEVDGTYETYDSEGDADAAALAVDVDEVADYADRETAEPRPGLYAAIEAEVEKALGLIFAAAAPTARTTVDVGGVWDPFTGPRNTPPEQPRWDPFADADLAPMPAGAATAAPPAPMPGPVVVVDEGAWDDSDLRALASIFTATRVRARTLDG